MSMPKSEAGESERDYISCCDKFIHEEDKKMPTFPLTLMIIDHKKDFFIF
jgi:hypothetical protein